MPCIVPLCYPGCCCDPQAVPAYSTCILHSQLATKSNTGLHSTKGRSCTCSSEDFNLRMLLSELFAPGQGEHLETGQGRRGQQWTGRQPAQQPHTAQTPHVARPATPERSPAQAPLIYLAQHTFGPSLPAQIKLLLILHRYACSIKYQGLRWNAGG